MTHTKLKISIKLIDDVENSKYYIYFTFLDIDERFDCDNMKTLYYQAKNNFIISSKWDEPFGYIGYRTLSLPRLDKIGFEFKKFFFTDQLRKIYLKMLRDALDEWANYYDGFLADSVSYLDMDEEFWTITCRQKKNVRYYSNHEDSNVNWTL